jgi:hypothetical protein
VPNLTALGQYRIQAELGNARFSETYHAYDMVRHRMIALKLLHPGLLDSEQAYWDFLDQVEQASELVHPHIAWIWEIGHIAGRFFMVERFVNGPSLANRLSQSGPLPWEQAQQAVDQIAQALEFATAKGWVHGRVTPHNILLGPDQSAVLSDYGLQRALGFSRVSSILQISTYDAQYLSLEALRGQATGLAADAYALACSLLEMLAGKNPFAADSLAEIEQKHAAPLVEPLFPPENGPWQISRVLEQALSPEPGERFKNASELVVALKHATSPGGVDRNELARREAQVEAWRLTEQQGRLQAEETARLAALEQARREIQEQAHREVQALEGLEAEAAVGETAPPASARRARRRPERPGPLPFLAMAAIVLVALTGYWINQRLSAGNLAQPTPTVTIAIQPAVKGTEADNTAPASATLSNTPSHTFTATASLMPSATLTPSSTATKKPTITPSLTLQPSPTPLPSSTFTPVKPEKPDNPGRRP